MCKAAKGGNLDLIKEMIEKWVDLLARDNERCTWLRGGGTSR